MGRLRLQLGSGVLFVRTKFILIPLPFNLPFVTPYYVPRRTSIVILLGTNPGTEMEENLCCPHFGLQIAFKRSCVWKVIFPYLLRMAAVSVTFLKVIQVNEILQRFQFLNHCAMRMMTAIL